MRGIFTDSQRRLAWLTLVAMTLSSVLSAWTSADDGWMLNLTIAALVGATLVIDDVTRVRALARERPAVVRVRSRDEYSDE
jgi:hypothetical protein